MHGMNKWVYSLVLGLGSFLLLLTLKRFIFTHTQLKVNRHFENNIWRHLLNIINDRIVEVLRFSVARTSESEDLETLLMIDDDEYYTDNCRRQSWVMDPIIEKAKDSYLVSLGEGRRRRFP